MNCHSKCIDRTLYVVGCEWKKKFLELIKIEIILCALFPLICWEKQCFWFDKVWDKNMFSIDILRKQCYSFSVGLCYWAPYWLGPGVARTGRTVCVPSLLDSGSAWGNPQWSWGTEGLLGETPTTAGWHCHPGAWQAVQTDENHTGGPGGHWRTRQRCGTADGWKRWE